MTAIVGSQPSTVMAPEGAAPTVRADLKMLAYWVTLGAAAGGAGGVVVGGIGGRLAMLLLRFTSHDSVRGVESDDGFEIGRFDFISTANLLVVTAVLGAILGLVMVAGRPFFPKRGMPIAWGVAGALAGGAILISADGVDFTLLGPLSLAIVLFIAIPAVGAFAIAWLVSQYPRFWWRNRGATAVAFIAAIPAVVFFPIAIAAIVVAGLWLVALRVRVLRGLHLWLPARVAALVVFAAITVLGAADLIGDVEDIL